MKKKLKEMYLDWANNFLSVPKFADHYGISEAKAHKVIKLGKVLHQQTISEADFYRDFHAYMKHQILDQSARQNTGFGF